MLLFPLAILRVTLYHIVEISRAAEEPRPKEVRCMPQDARQLWQRIGIRCLILAALIPLVTMGLPACWYLFGPFLLSLLLAAPLQRPIAWLQKRLKMKRWLAVLLMLLLVYVVIGLFVYWFMSFAVTQAIAALQNAPQSIDRLTNLYHSFRNWLTSQFDESFNLTRLDDMIGKGLSQLTTWASQLAGTLLTGTVNTAKSLPGILLFANFLILSSFFIARDYPIWRERLFRQRPDSTSARLRVSAVEAVTGYLRVQVIYTLIVLIVSATAFSIFGIPYAFVIACVAALLEFLPIFGNGTLYVPLIIILYLVRETRIATIILIVHLFFYIGRKVTEPRLMKSQMGLSPVLSLVTMYLGLQLGSVLGLTLAPIVAVVVQAAVRAGFFNGAVSDFRDGIRWVRNKLKRD